MSLDIFEKKEPLTTSESQTVVKDIKSEIEKIKKEIDARGATAVGVDFLQSKKDLLQNKLNELLKKGRLITEEDYNETYQIIRSKKEQELKTLYNKANKRVITFIGIAVLVYVGIYLLVKKK